jgi:hypothetical protein
MGTAFQFGFRTLLDAIQMGRSLIQRVQEPMLSYDLFLCFYAYNVRVHMFFTSVSQQTPVGQGLLNFEASRWHSVTHDFSGRVISPMQRDLYLTTHNTHNRQTSMPSERFEPTAPASKRPDTHALDRAATGPVLVACISVRFCEWCVLRSV